MSNASRSESGQSTVEWIGLVLIVSLLIAALGAVIGLAVPAVGLAQEIGARLLCAAELGAGCEAQESKLVAAYGEEVASLVAEHTPTVVYERGMGALPVDYRSCREDPCSMGAEKGKVVASERGEPVTLFVHVADCRDGSERPGELDCSGRRAGNLYLQYWAYYPGSHTKVWGERGFHRDDWESLQTRIGSGRIDSRASSHNGYNHRDGAGNWLSDTGLAKKAGWGASERRYYVSGGSHAGHAADPFAEPHRWTPGESVRLIALEPIAARRPRVRFEVTPPWRKRVWNDPEYEGTD